MCLRSSFKRSAKERAGFVVVVTLIGCLAWLGHATALKSPTLSVNESTALQPQKKEKKGPPCNYCGPPGNQYIYAPLIDLPESQGGEIVFNSRSPKAMDITPVFYTLNGETVIADPVRIESAEIRYVNVMDLLPERYRHEHFGGFALTYYGYNREMWSQFRFIGVNGGGNVDEFFTVKEEARAENYQAAWWTPEKGEAIVALGNITDEATSATVTFGGGRTRTVSLRPHATEVIRDQHSKKESTESVNIDVTGAPGSIVSTGIVTSKDHSFNSVIRFYDPARAKQANLYANGFRVSGNNPHMILKNTTTSSIAVVPKFIPLSGNKPFVSSDVVLAPNETTEVDLQSLVRTAGKRHDLDVVSVEVTNPAGPGSIIGSIYGVDAASGTNYDVPLRDSGLVRTMTGSYPWKIDDDFTTLVYITNISDQEAAFIGEVNYQGGHVVLEPHKLAAGETAMFDLQAFRDKQLTDSMGNKLPADVTLGQFKWSVHGVTNGKLLLIGRAEMVSRSQNISTSYSCNDPCPPFLGGSIDPYLPPIIVINATANTVAYQTAYYGNGYSYTYPYPADWSTSSNLSCWAYSGNTETIRGDFPGDGCATADMGWQESYGWDGLNCYDNNNQYWVGDSSCTNVPANIRRLQYIAGGAGNMDILGTLYVLKGTTVTFNALPDPPAAEFASGQPTWSGTSGISGSGQSKQVTFNTASTSATDFKTVKATAGNTLTANVIVFELAGTLTPDDNFSGHSVDSLGIHERVTLGANITPSDVTAAAIGGIQWVQDPGGGTLTGANTAGEGTYRAANTAESATLKLTILDGPSKNMGPPRALTVVAPSAGSVAQLALTGIKHTQDWWSCGFLGDIFVTPANVSFRNIFFKEEEVAASASGWLSFLNGSPHNASTQGLPISGGNSSTGGHVLSDGDQIFSGQFRSLEHGAYATGSVSWAIPWDYSVDNGTYTRFVIVTQTATSTSTGKCTIKKDASPTFSAELSDASSNW